MGVLCAAILSKNVTYLTRSYTDISPARLNALLSKFRNYPPESVCVEEDGVRFLMALLDNANADNAAGACYLLLITDLASNIIVDVDLLRSIRPALANNGNSSLSFSDRAYEIIFILDEMISPLGDKEYINEMELCKCALTLESTHAKIIELEKKQKERDETERRRRRAIELGKEHIRNSMAAPRS